MINQNTQTENDKCQLLIPLSANRSKVVEENINVYEKLRGHRADA